MSDSTPSFDMARIAEPLRRYREFLRQNEETAQEIIRTVFGANILDAAQVKDRLATGGKLLDIGCGRGIWLHEVAEQYRNCTCEGIDILPVDEADRRHDLHNVVFHTGDVTEGLPFEDNTFDFVHMRAMKDEFDNATWSRLVVEIFRILKPGGWLQTMEMGEMTRVGSQGELLNRMGHEFQALSGTEGEFGGLAENLEEYVKRATPLVGSVKKKTVPVPLGWGGDIARTTLNMLANSYIAIKPILAIVFGDSENVEKIVRDWRSECAIKRSFVNVYAVAAIKSLDEPGNDDSIGE